MLLRVCSNYGFNMFYYGTFEFKHGVIKPNMLLTSTVRFCFILFSLNKKSPYHLQHRTTLILSVEIRLMTFSKSLQLSITSPWHFQRLFLFYRRNILPEMNDAYLRSCQRENDSLCPIFRLGDIIREAGEKFSEMAIEVRLHGLLFLQ